MFISLLRNFLVDNVKPMAAIDIMLGTINKLWGKIPSIEKRNPLTPYSFTKKPTVNPIAKPLNRIVAGIVNNPITTIPVTQINIIVLKLSTADCFNIDILSNVFPSMFLKKELRNIIILFLCSVFRTFIVIAPTTTPNINKIVIIR